MKMREQVGAFLLLVASVAAGCGGRRAQDGPAVSSARTAGWRPVHRITLPGDDGCTFALITSDGRRVVTGGSQGVAFVIDAETGRIEHRLAGHTSVILAADLAPDERTFATTGNDGSVRVWDLVEGKQLLRTGHKLPPDGQLHLHGLVYTPDGKTIFTSGWEKTVRKWDVATGRQILSLFTPLALTAQCWVSPDGSSIFVYAGQIFVGDAANGGELRSLGEGCRGGCGTDDGSVYVTADGRTLVLINANRTMAIRHIEIETGKETKTVPLAFERKEGEAIDFFFSPDRTLLAAGFEGGAVRVFETAAGKELFSAAENSPETSWMGGIAFSADNAVMVSADSGGRVVIWRRAGR